MAKPGEHKTVQARILAYAEAIGWTIVLREEAEQWPGLKESGLSSPLGSGKDAGWKTRAPLSLFFDDLLDAKVREFNPCYAEAEGMLLGSFRHLHANICGNREFSSPCAAGASSSNTRRSASCLYRSSSLPPPTSSVFHTG